MSIVHYRDESIDGSRSPCGEIISGGIYFSTDQREKVTCESCIRCLEAREKQKIVHLTKNASGNFAEMRYESYCGRDTVSVAGNFVLGFTHVEIEITCKTCLKEVERRKKETDA